MTSDSLIGALNARINDMPPQLRLAARYLIEHPQDVALHSMREMARRAGVQPATMTRLARFLGASGYEDLRREQADLIRRGTGDLISHARNRAEPGSGAQQAGTMLEALARQMDRLNSPEQLDRIAHAADALAAAGRIHVLGARSCHSPAWHFHYVMSLLGEKTRLLDGPGGTGPDGLMRAEPGDALLVFSVHPYARLSLDLAGLAADRGLSVIAVTDSEVSPLIPLAAHAVICPAESAGIFHSLTPAMAVAELLCNLLAGRNRGAALAALEQADRQLKALNSYGAAIPRRR
ncbi:MAG: MurR/RpiR family transcriptional regulator [Paracoccus sp. (in: a-proteobacteria)]